MADYHGYHHHLTPRERARLDQAIATARAKRRQRERREWRDLWGRIARALGAVIRFRTS